MRTSTICSRGAIAASLILALAFLGTAGADDLRDELEALSAQYDKAIVEGDVETIMSFYADDVVTLPNYGKRTEGKEALKERMVADREAGLIMESFTGRIEEAWECDGMVYEVGSYALSISLPDVARPIGDKGKYMTVYRREKGDTLKIVYTIWNTDIEPGK